MVSRPSSSMEEGEGWWWAQSDGVKTWVGADLSVLRQLSGHTTTQPSSIEEEGEKFQGFARLLESLAGR